MPTGVLLRSPAVIGDSRRRLRLSLRVNVQFSEHSVGGVQTCEPLATPPNLSGNIHCCSFLTTVVRQTRLVDANKSGV